MNNLPKVVAQQRRGRASNPRLLDRKSDALPLSHRATQLLVYVIIAIHQQSEHNPLQLGLQELVIFIKIISMS